MITLWHCHNTRSLRPLWALEEIGVEYELRLLPFPPRVHDKSFFEHNPLGTVPYFVDGEVRMTESTAICQYVVDRYGGSRLAISADHSEYASYLNFMYQSDATYTFPQALYLRYSLMETDERKQPQVAEDYRRWFLARLRWLDQHLLQTESQYLCDNRFTMADIAVAYALYLAELNGIAADFTPQTQRYLDTLKQRPAFIRCQQIVNN